MTDILDPSALLSVLPSLLPPSSSPSTPLLRHPSDALAALIHTIMTRLDFRLTGLSETDRLASPSSSSSDSSSSSSTSALPSNWNTGGPDHYAFRYKHHQSSLDFLVKLVKLGGKVVVHGIAMQGTQTSSVEVVVGDFTSESFWPWPNDGGEPLVNGYIGSSRVKDLTGLFKRGVLQELVPGLRKDGYTEEESSESSRQPERPSAGDFRPRPAQDPYHPQANPSTQQPPFRSPLIIGDRDLDPLGGSPLALPPRFGGGSGGSGSGGGFAPPPLFPGGDTGGGMFVGPNHPMFRDRLPPNTGLPPGAVPPGARFDPIYPTGGGPFNPDREPDVGGARPQHFGSGEPDWDELAPPRGENPFGGARGGRGGGGFGGRPDTGGWYS